MKVFMDTYALIALVNTLDAAHKKVLSYMLEHRGPIVTTEYVLLEFADALSHPDARLSATEAIDRLRNDPQFEILPGSDSLFDSGMELFGDRPDKYWSLTDCISFQVMAAAGISDALTADHHFEQAGFTAIFAE